MSFVCRAYCATQFDTVEVDSTFYRAPSERTVRGWYAKTPPGFLFAAKFSQAITHEKVLADCDAEVREFLTVMDALGEKLGPLLIQFPWFSDTAFLELDDFLARLPVPPLPHFAITPYHREVDEL